MFQQRFQCEFGWSKVKYARITITHVCFIALTLAGSRGCCLNTRLPYKHSFLIFFCQLTVTILFPYIDTDGSLNKDDPKCRLIIEHWLLAIDHYHAQDKSENYPFFLNQTIGSALAQW